MEGFSFWNIGILPNTISLILIVFCFYYTLSFLEHLKGDDIQAIKKAKRAAVIYLGAALAVPALTAIYYLFQMS